MPPFNLDQFDLKDNRTELQAERVVLDLHHAALEAIVVNPGFIFLNTWGATGGANRSSTGCFTVASSSAPTAA